MKFLIWLQQIRLLARSDESLADQDIECWGGWRELYLKGHSPEDALYIAKQDRS